MPVQIPQRETRPTADIDLVKLTKIKPVPALSRGSMKLLRALNNPDVPFDELTESLRNFPTIVARLLALANSPWSSPATPVASLDDAVPRLGLDIVRSFTVALLVSCPFNSARCQSFDVVRYWCTALLTSEAAAALARETPSDMGAAPVVARTAGLICNLGLLWLADVLPEIVNNALATAEDRPALSVNDALLAECGLSYGDAGAALGKLWRLPPQLAAAMAYRQPDVADGITPVFANLIRVANDMAADIYAGSSRVNADAVVAALDIDADTYCRINADLVQSLPELTEFARSTFHAPRKPL